MKRLTTLLVVMMVVMTAMAQQISVNDAMARAAALRPAKQSPAKGSAAQQTLMPMLCHTAEDQGNTLYYAFNYPEGGFAIIGGDNVARPILGYSEKGRFSMHDMPDALKKMLEQYSKEISLAIKLQKTKGNVSSSLQNAKAATGSLNGIATSEKKDLHVDLKTKWNQEYPFNSQLKSTRGKNLSFLTGCVATAGAQMMKFYGYPEKGVGSNEYTVKVKMPKESEDFDTIFSANYDDATYDWSLMHDTYDREEELTEEEELAIGNLLRDVGVSVNMNYGVNARGGSSSALTDLGHSLIEHFGYDKGIDNNSREYYTKEQWDNMLQADLAEGRPVLYRGNSSLDGGHAFIIHGYNVEDDTYEINWGWGGHYNGHYSINGVNALNYSDIVGAGFSNQQGMVRKVKPDEGGEPEVNVVLNSPIIFDNGTKQTTVDRKQDGLIRIGRMSILNEGFFDTNIYYAIECQNIEDGKKYIIEGKRKISISANRYTYFPETFSIKDDPNVMLENGIYEVRPLYRQNPTDEWKYMPVSQTETLSTVVVNGGINKPTKDVIFTIDETIIQEGEKAQISHNEGYAGTISYGSDDEEVAKVNSQGVITAIAPGKTTIHVVGLSHGAYRNTSMEFEITVIEHSVNAVDMTISSKSIFVGSNCDISITSASFNGDVTYSSSNDSIAVVTPEGKVVGIRPGVAYIMAKTEGAKNFHTTARFFDVTVKDTVALEDGICFYEPVEASNDGLIVSGMPLYIKMPVANTSEEPLPALVFFKVFLNEWEPFLNAGYWGYTQLFPANYKQTDYFDYSKYVIALSNIINDGDVLRIEFYKDEEHTQPFNIPSVSIRVCYPNNITYTQPANKYGTLMLAFDTNVPEGLKAYECNGYANNDAILKEVSTMKANTPYIMYGEAGDYTFTGPLTTGRNYLQGNGFLMGKTEGDVVLSDYDYVPSQTRGVSSFACYTAGGTKLADRSAFITTDSTYLAPYVMLPKLEGEEQQTMVMGDADGDGKVTMHDANIATSHYLGNYVKIDTDAADTNEDGEVTMTDANAIVNRKE